MNCSIGGPKVKYLSKAILTLARIGEDLFIESSSSGLELCAVNGSRSAYVRFLFKPEYFVEFKSDGAKCKVSSKSCVMAFRSFQTMEKSIELCLVNTSAVENTLLVQFSCKHDLTKIFHLPVFENETMQADFNADSSTCKLTAKAKVLAEGIQNFSTNVQEITLIVSTSQIILKSHFDDDEARNKAVHTEFILEPQEFEEYVVADDLNVTFVLNDLKAVLSFAESFKASVTIYCQSSGKPIIITLDLQELESKFVLATLSDRSSEASCTPAEGSFLCSMDSRASCAAGSRKTETKKSKARKVTGMSVNIVTTGKNLQGMFNNDAGEPSTIQSVPAEPLDDIDADILAFEQNQDFDDNEEVVVPLTPPKKRFRINFLGLSSQASQCTTVLSETDEVLVAESDEED